MRILHVISGLGTGGAETMLLRLATRLNAKRHVSLVVSLTAEGAMLPLYRDGGVDVEDVDLRSPLQLPSATYRLVRVARQFAPDVIQGWMNHGNVAAYVAWRLSRRSVKLAWNIRQTIHDIRFEKTGTQRAIRLAALLSAAPDIVLFNSVAAVPQHEAIGFHCRSVRVVPNGFDTETLRPSLVARAAMRTQLKVGTREFLVGLVARYHAMKDQDTFVRAMARVMRAVPGTRAVLVGAGMDNNASLSALTEQLGIRQRVDLCGERSNLQEFYPALDVLCLTSVRSEGFPNVVGEAMCCGVPCVVTDVGDAAQVVGEAGFVVPPRNPSAVAEAVIRILQLPELERTRLGARARARIVAEFSIETVADEYERVYEGLIDDTTGLLP